MWKKYASCEKLLLSNSNTASAFVPYNSAASDVLRNRTTTSYLPTTTPSTTTYRTPQEVLALSRQQINKINSLSKSLIYLGLDYNPFNRLWNLLVLQFLKPSTNLFEWGSINNDNEHLKFSHLYIPFYIKNLYYFNTE